MIVWDPATHTQHFIRRATFDTASPDFGFLVPTPTAPALAEASDNAFTRLEDLIKPKTLVNHLTGIDLTPLFLRFFLLYKAPMAGVSGVQVLSSQRVAGYDAVVLEADNASALTGWLKDHGYAARPALTVWLAPYIASRWKVTAFKISKDGGERQVATSAVRMSFKTDRPFFPYREPEDQRDQRAGSSYEPRLLRVFMLSTARMDGGIGEPATSLPWPGRVIWSDQLEEGSRARLAEELALPSDQLPNNLWLTAFEDRSTPRPGTDDLYFAPSKTEGRVVLPPVVYTHDDRVPVPIDLATAVLVLVGGLISLVWLGLRHHPYRAVKR